MAARDASINVARLLHLADASLDARALGQLVALLADELHPRAPRGGALRLVVAGGLAARLADADFIEALGAEHLKTARLLRLAFSRAGDSPARAIAAVAGMAAAGALNVYSASALAALHEGIAGWRVPIVADLVGRIAEGLDSFAQAGLFISLLLAAPGCALDAAGAAALLRAVVARPDVRDLAGAPADMMRQLPRDAAAAAADELRARAESDDSDADEDGNLAGFVCGDDEESAEESAGDDGSEAGSEDDEEEDEDDDESGGSDDDESAGAAGGRRAGVLRRGGSAVIAPGFRSGLTAPTSPRRSFDLANVHAPAAGAFFDALCEIGAAPPTPHDAAPSPALQPAARADKRPRESGAASGGGRAALRARYIDGEARVGRAGD
jgi:hypothetical protein